MPSFSEQMRKKSSPLFDAVYEHPFVQDIVYQRLPREVIIYYVRQDIQYLNTYAKVYGMALAKSRTREQMLLFQEKIRIVLDGELIPHQNLCRVAGVNYEDLHTPTQMAPTAHHYARHMLTAAYTGQLGDIIAAVLPCHWVYVDIAERMIKNHDILSHPSHAFYDWITFYAGDEVKNGLYDLTTLLDEIAPQVGAADRENIEAIFDEGCRLEYRFFDMAYTRERWLPNYGGGRF